MGLQGPFVSVNEADSNGEPANVVDGLFAIARALERVATSLERLGLADAATPKGALELVAQELHGIADSIEHHGFIDSKQ